MAPTIDNPPLPGTWVKPAQEALDTLSTMATIEKVADEFGAARAIAVAVLGAPAAGGSATRPTIWATGHLLTHRLGPALAAEALSWAASVAELVSASAIEEFLTAATESEIVCRPLRLDDRHVLHGHLERCRTDSERRDGLAQLWQSRGDHFRWRQDDVYLSSFDWSSDSFQEPPCWAIDAPPCSNPDHPICWADSGTAMPGPERPTGAEVFASHDGLSQRRLFDLLGWAEQAEVAADDRLFDLDEEVVASCLVDHTATVLANPACPQGLRDRVRYPYDPATLELAIRSGPGHFEVARARHILEDLNEAEHRRYMEQLQLPYLRSLRACGLNTLGELTTGRLAGLDLSDRDTAEAILGTPDDWHWRRLPNHVVDVLVHHPQAADLAWSITGTGRPVIGLDLARRLAREAPVGIAQIALRDLIPVEQLEADDAALALTCGDYWSAQCPGIAAEHRPAARIPTVYEGPIQASWLDLDRRESRLSPRRSANAPFVYPEVIETLQRPYLGAPGWTVSLPETPADLAANADAMRNCSSGYWTAIDAGDSFIVVIEDPSGRRYNAAVNRSNSATGPRYRVGEVNSWANRGHAPDWITPAMNARLATPFRPLDPPEPPERRPRRPGSRSGHQRRRTIPRRPGRP